MGQNKHDHSYPQAVPLEAFDIETLRRYWEEVPEKPSLPQLVVRSHIETELLYHPAADDDTRQTFLSRRKQSDEQLIAKVLPLGDINTRVSRAFAPLLLDHSKDIAASMKLVRRRAKRIFDLCEDTLPTNPELALGLCAETFFNLLMNDGNTAASPSLRREDKGWKYEEAPYSWDSTVVSLGTPPIAKGLYRVQIKYGQLSDTYHPDITVVHVNPYGKHHVTGAKFIDLARLLLPGTTASQADLDKLNLKTHAIHETMRRHGPSVLQKIAGACLVNAA